MQPNFICDIDRYLDAKVNDANTILEFICQICQWRRLTISALAKTFTLSDGQAIEPVEPLNQLVNLYAHGFEQTIILPCGHVFGDRCIRGHFLAQRDLACPACGFRMTYRCGHAIPPAIIPIAGSSSIRDTFPLTIPEGGPIPSQCKQCRWEAIQARLRYALASKCVICAQKVRAGVPPKAEDSGEHDVHYARHLDCGIKKVLSEIMMLVQPDFITRVTKDSAQKTLEEGYRQQANTALLNTIVFTELGDTIWQGTAMKQLSEEQVARHDAGVREVEYHILGLLTDKHCRPQLPAVAPLLVRAL
ncbi:hypothetical protein F5Y10DRAFT_272393 [Nemania abortiva]|nr:hypothetical protein F5Y10DRAFT_272393 [Nemania abortiva]